MSVKKIGNAEGSSFRLSGAEAGYAKDCYVVGRHIEVFWAVHGLASFKLNCKFIETSPEILSVGPGPEKPYPEVTHQKMLGDGSVRFTYSYSEQYKKLLFDYKNNLLPKYEKKLTDAIQQVIERFENKSKNEPVALSDGKHYLFRGSIYKFDRPGYSSDEMIFQIMELEDKDRQKFERLRNKFSVAKQEETKRKRELIPEEVRIAVWRRDEGRCTKCHSRENLEYDHIIPFSKGGSNSVRNIELLCEKCNREKRDNIQ